MPAMGLLLGEQGDDDGADGEDGGDGRDEPGCGVAARRGRPA